MMTSLFQANVAYSRKRFMAARTVQVYTSVAEEIKARIAAGDWVVGQRLPSISQLALAMERLGAEGLDFSEPDLHFHRQIAVAAHNPVLARMMDGVNDLLRESQKITREQAMTHRAVHYHLLIADAICERNPLQ